MRVGGSLAATAVLVGVLPAVSACGGGSDGEARTELVVSAAASLTDAFGAMADAWEQRRPEVDVTLNLAGSSTLAVQVVEGAPVDVFASADSAQMARVGDAGLLADEPRIFARNELVVVVPAGNPARIEGLDDFAREELLLGLCAAAVPCGSLAREALRSAGVEPSIDTAEPDVRALLTKVAVGELDAGIVYATDLTAAGDAVEAVPIPSAVNVTARYPIAVLRDVPHPDAARAFVDFVLSERGRAILREHGFGLP